jgi:hypothetical protein
MWLGTKSEKTQSPALDLRKSSTALSVVRAGAEAQRATDGPIPVTVSTFPCSRRVTPLAHGWLGKASDRAIPPRPATGIPGHDAGRAAVGMALLPTSV